MRQIVVFFYFSLVFSTLAFSMSAVGKFSIKGTVSRSFDGQRAILSKMNSSHIPIDTDTSIIRQGRFSFEGDEFLDNISTIVVEDKQGTQTCPRLEILLETGNTSVSFSKNRSSMKGIPLNNLFMEYQDLHS